MADRKKWKDIVLQAKGHSGLQCQWKKNKKKTTKKKKEEEEEEEEKGKGKEKDVY